LAVVDRDVRGSADVDPRPVALVVGDPVDRDVGRAVDLDPSAQVVAGGGLGTGAGDHSGRVNVDQPDGGIGGGGVVVSGGDPEDVEVVGDLATGVADLHRPAAGSAARGANGPRPNDEGVSGSAVSAGDTATGGETRVGGDGDGGVLPGAGQGRR